MEAIVVHLEQAYQKTRAAAERQGKRLPCRLAPPSGSIPLRCRRPVAPAWNARTSPLADESCKAPPGKFRVAGWDRYDATHYPIADCATREEALARAKEEARAARGRASPPSLADVIQVYDDRGRLLKAFGA